MLNPDQWPLPYFAAFILLSLCIIFALGVFIGKAIQRNKPYRHKPRTKSDYQLLRDQLKNLDK